MKRRVAALIERAQRGEDIGIRGDEEALDRAKTGKSSKSSDEDGINSVDFARLECILSDYFDRGIAPSDDDIEFIMLVLRDRLVLPRSRGRRAAAEEIRKREAEAYVWGRVEKARLTRPGVSAEDAGKRAANKMLERYPAPLFMSNAERGRRLSVETVADRLMRRSPHRQ